MNALRKSIHTLAAVALVFAGGAAAETAFIHFEDLDAGTNVGGTATLHPFLTIESLHGSDSMLVVETGNLDPFAYGSPNPVWNTPLATNNCLEDQYGLRVDMFDPGNERTAKGFSDVEALDLDTPQEFALTFEGRRVKSLSLLMTDFGDFNPERETYHEVGLWAYRDGDAVPVDSHIVTYRSEAAPNPRNSPEMGDLYFTGDACVCDEGAVGHTHLKVEVGPSELGFDWVELRSPIGGDPHVAFDSIYIVYEEEDIEFAGCTPGYWKQKHHLDSWPPLPTGYAPTELYGDIFGVNASFDDDGTVTLLKAVALGGGGEKALARHAVAALLNAASYEVLYPFSKTEVIGAVQAAYTSGDFEGIKDEFEEANELGCPLD